MLSPLSLISLIRWVFFALTLVVSVFVNRWLGFGLLVALIAWELVARVFAPHHMIKKLKKQRLRRQHIRQIMTHSLWTNHKGETELLELSADWPLVLLIPHQKPRLFFHNLLSEKLDHNEMSMVVDWLFLLHQRKVAFAGLQLILLLAPMTFLMKSLDRMGFRSSKPGQFSWNGSFHKLISPLLYPFFEEHRIVRNLLSERHGHTSVCRLQDKLNHLVKAHGGWPPADFAYLCLDPLYLFKQKSFYFFSDTQSLKESFHGSKS